MRIRQFDPLIDGTGLKPLHKPYGHEIAESAALKAFIASVFKKHYNANIEAFCDRLMGVRGEDGELVAAAGINLANEGPLFLEQYLTQPIEEIISAETGLTVFRHEIAEVGNLAALQAGGTRKLIVRLTNFLKEQGRPWVAFTATKSLINSFNKLGLAPVVIADANKNCVANPQAWGSYYDHQPQVTFGNVILGYHSLLASRSRANDVLRSHTEVQ